MKELKKDKLKVKIAETREEMGRLAAADIRAKMLELLSEREYINMIFAAAPSQNETLAALLEYDDIDWTKVNAFHMDEYVGLAKDAPQRFGNFLSEHIFSKKPFRSVNYIDPSNTAEAECARYTALLTEYPTDIVVLGIGENGHIAFNDPGVADFNDKAMIKVVELDEVCRNQQVNDGCFAKLSDVPTNALTLTVPTLVKASALFCSVPAKTKAWAVKETLTTDKIDEHCPATVMRLHNDATLYCDSDSASML
jgi:glucosamine-6-phosphate deaminase